MPEHYDDDPREKYDPDNPYQSALINILPYVNLGMLDDQTKRMQQFYRQFQTKDKTNIGMPKGEK